MFPQVDAQEPTLPPIEDINRTLDKIFHQRLTDTPAPINQMPHDLVKLVIGFINDRALRSALGFGFERCIQDKIPPASLTVDPEFQAHLQEVQQAWLKKPVGGQLKMYADGAVRVHMLRMNLPGRYAEQNGTREVMNMTFLTPPPSKVIRALFIGVDRDNRPWCRVHPGLHS